MNKQKSFQIILIIALIMLSYTDLKSQDSTVQFIDGCSNVMSITNYLHPLISNIYGEEKIKGLTYPNFKYSPTGRFLAIEISPETYDSFNSEVWLIDIKTKKTRMIVERAPTAKVEIVIKGFKWISDSSILVFIHRNDREHRMGLIYSSLYPPKMDHPENEKYNGDFVNWATMDSSIVYRYQGTDEDAFVRREDWYIYSTSPSGKWRFVSPPRNDTMSLIDLQNKLTYLCPFKYRIAHNYKWTYDEKYVVFNEGGGSGGMRLCASLMKTSLKSFEIANGSWEMGGFCIAPKGHFIAYFSPDIVNSNAGINIYNIDKRKIVKIIQIGKWPDKVEWSNQNFFAVTCRSCNSHTENGKPHYDYGLYVYDMSSFFK